MANDRKETIRGLVRRYASEFGVPYPFALAILESESSYDPQALSPRGAQGLMQLMPQTSKTYNVTDPFDPDQNVRAGIQHLSILLNRYQGDQRLAAAAYNAGEGAVKRARGVPNFPETQQYVQAVQSLTTQLQPTEPPASTNGEINRVWIYPTLEQQDPAYTGTSLFGKSGDEPLPADDPKREGIMISWTGAREKPTEEEIDFIFSQVNPEGVFTREDLGAGGAAAATIGRDVSSLTKRGVGALTAAGRAARPALSASSKFLGPAGWLGMPLLAGVGAMGGELYRQSLVPESIAVPGARTFGIESWPRENMAGIDYEGAPNTAAEQAWAMAVAGAGEATMEMGGGLVASGLKAFGKAYKGSAFPSTARAAQETRLIDPKTNLLVKGPDPRQAPMDFGISTTESGARSAANVARFSDVVTSKLVSEADTALDNPMINKSQLIEDFYKNLGVPLVSSKNAPGVIGLATPVSTFRTTEIARKAALGQPQLQNEAAKIANQLSVLGGESPFLTLMDANAFRKTANSLGRQAFEKGADESVSVVPRVQKAAAQALRKNLVDTMRVMEPSIARRGLFGRLPRFAERFEKSLERPNKVLNAEELARKAAGVEVPGGFTLAAAYSLPALAGLGYQFAGPKGLAGGALVGAALSQVLPRGRQLVGGSIYRAGTQAASVPPNILRGIQGYKSQGYRQPSSLVSRPTVRPPFVNLPSLLPSRPGPSRNAR